MNSTISASTNGTSATGKPRTTSFGHDGYLGGDASGIWTGADPASPQDAPWYFAYASPWSPATFPNSPSPPVNPTVAGVSSVTPSGSTALTQVLYLQEPGNPAAISVYDINQGQMGDCYLLSSIGEIALFHPSWISQMIQANADGTETVRLYRAANGSLPSFGTTAYTPVSINVANSFPANAVNNGATQDAYNGQKEIWVQVLEKAMATLYGGYNGIANGGIPSISMEELTGCPAYSTSPVAVSLQQLQTAIAAGDLITFDTPGIATLPYALYGDHAYMFQSLTTVNGTVMVNLLNPWGFDEPNPIPFSQLGTAIDEIDFDQFTKTTNLGPALAQQTPDQTWAQGSHVSLSLAGAFSEASGAKLTYVAAQANGQPCPTWLSFNASTMTFAGTVPSGMASLSLKVTATDTNGLSCSETFKATVPAAAPTLAHQTAAQTWTEGATVAFTLPANTFADPNGQTLSYSAALSNGQALPSWLTLNSASGVFSGTAGYTSGPLLIKVTATDASGLSASETLQATLVAPAPVLTAQTANQTWTAGRVLSFALGAGTFTAVPGQTLKYAATLPSGLTINPTTGTISGTVPFGLGIYGIMVSATETSGLSVSETFKATVVASAPTVHQTAAQNWTANQSVSLSVASAFADPQGESLTYTTALSNGKPLPAGLTFNPTTATLAGIAPTSLGSLAIMVTAKDQSGLSASETIACVVSARAPVPANSTASRYWVANKAVTFTLPSNAFVDPQGEQLTYAATMADGSALPSWIKFNAASGVFTGTAPVSPQTLSLAVTATDQSGLAAKETFQAAVQASAPSVTNQTGPLTWTVGKAVSAALASNTFSDPQGEAMRLVATLADGSALPSGLTFNATTDSFSGTAPITPQSLGLKVTATDASGLSVSDKFSVTIQAAPPTLAHQTANQVWATGSAMSFLLPANTFVDPQGAALSYAAFETSGPDLTSWLKFAASSAAFSGIPPATLAGSIGIKVVATDAYGLSTSESFSLTFAAAGAHVSPVSVLGATEMLALHG